MTDVNDVCAVIVTYNPDRTVFDNIERIQRQVGQLIIVDNGSPPKELVPLLSATQGSPSAIVLQHGANLGIAAALNTGVRQARAFGFPFVALFDQDSTAEERLIESLLETYLQNCASRRVGLVAAKHMKTDTREWMQPVYARDGGPLVAITSGSLIPLSTFDHSGLFEEDLIIDRVDEEFCLRIRTQGFTVLQCDAGILWVTLGNPKPFRLGGHTLFYATHYSPSRRYYITRNRLIIVKRYWRKFPKWCYWALTGLVKELLILLIVEDEKGAKLRKFIKGVRDGITGRLGMAVHL